MANSPPAPSQNGESICNIFRCRSGEKLSWCRNLSTFAKARLLDGVAVLDPSKGLLPDRRLPFRLNLATTRAHKRNQNLRRKPLSQRMLRFYPLIRA
jgi:hypothetical protein